MTKSHALLWFYDIFFCHANLLVWRCPYPTTDYRALDEELEKEPEDRRWPDETDVEIEEHFQYYPVKDYRPKFAKKCGKSLREIRIYEQQVKSYKEWSSSGQQDTASQPWYFALLELYTLLFNKTDVVKKEFLDRFSMNERTFKRYLALIRKYETMEGGFEFSLAYDAKKKVYHRIPSGHPLRIFKASGMKPW